MIPFPKFRETVHMIGINGPLCDIYKKDICPYIMKNDLERRKGHM
jgi:hypothetical protein